MNGYKCKAQFLKADKKMTDKCHVKKYRRVLERIK